MLPNDRYITTNSLLIIVNLTTADAGQYHCEIYDPVEKQITINTIQVIIKSMYVHMYIHIHTHIHICDLILKTDQIITSGISRKTNFKC